MPERHPALIFTIIPCTQLFFGCLIVLYNYYIVCLHCVCLLILFSCNLSFSCCITGSEGGVILDRDITFFQTPRTQREVLSKLWCNQPSEYLLFFQAENRLGCNHAACNTWCFICLFFPSLLASRSCFHVTVSLALQCTLCLPPVCISKLIKPSLLWEIRDSDNDR